MIINPYNFKVPLLLDTYPGAAAAYSLRKLRTAYTGYCIEVRRSSDDTTQNIGFTSAGVLDESALTTFCGAGNGFVKTWYDQTTNGNDAVQETTAYQPQIIASGSVMTVNSKPTLYFDVDDRLKKNFTAITQPLSIVLVEKVATASAFNLFYDGYGATNRVGTYGWSASDGKFTLFAGSDVATSISRNANQNILISLFNGSSSKLWMNNSGSSTLNPGTASLAGITIGNHNSSSSSYGLNNIQELIIYPSDQTSNVSGLNTAINSFYSIY